MEQFAYISLSTVDCKCLLHLIKKPRMQLRGRIHLGYLRVNRDDKSGMDLKEVGCGEVERIELAENRYRFRTLVNMLMNH